MGGTLGRYGSTSVENIDDFFSTIAYLTKTACTKKTQNFLKTEEGRPRRTFHG